MENRLIEMLKVWNFEGSEAVRAHDTQSADIIADHIADVIFTAFPGRVDEIARMLLEDFIKDRSEAEKVFLRSGFRSFR